MPTDQTLDRRRWLIAIMGTVLQVGLGTVYAWSFFQKPVKTHWGLVTDSPIAWIFCLAIFFLGVSAAVGGVLLPKVGPRTLALSGSILYPVGWMIGGLGLSSKSLALLYLGYGVVGGVGLGLGYVTPVATLAKWFPDRKGLVTGMVVMGFGFGALFLSKLVGPALMRACDKDLGRVFLWTGLMVAAICLPAALVLRNPPVGYVPAGYKPSASALAGRAGQADPTTRECLVSGRFAMTWLVFFFNICAGMMFIGFQSPMLQDLLKKSHPWMTGDALAAAGATLIAVSSIFNGLGRMFWGGVADRLGRIQTFRIILASQIAVFLALMVTPSAWVFGILVCYVLLCYGGGFGTMPSYVLDSFGAKIMPVVYGAILTAWSIAGIVGPQMVALIKDHLPSQAATATFGAAAGLLSLGLVISLRLTNESYRRPAPPSLRRR
jgi:MFS transporter, OFA family, oxalate/formate antiporter